ncbi:MAG: FAD-dependent oxidoreductase [Candidatus Dormibacteraeota bacterium]|nr:FAD-dependent oxidoreductase [Candidatus Dormibacteraeota bacterium]
MPRSDGLPDRARVVIIGAGIVGSSAAYHLTRFGWKDIVVLDQGPLFQTGGSTSHAPGMVFQNNVARTTCHIAMRSVDCYRDLQLDGEPLWLETGSLEVAATRERWEELKRKHGHATSWGLETTLVSPEEVKRLVPIMRTDHLFGAIHVPGDGCVRTVKACEAMARHAEPKGARFIGGTRVTGIEVRHGRVAAVMTDCGRIETENVLSAAGIWGPVVGKMAGVRIALQPMQHLYGITDPLPEPAGERGWQSMPIVRHQDRSMYFRQHYQSYLFGSYRHEPVLNDPQELRHSWEDGLMPSCVPFRDDLFEPAVGYARELYPPLSSAELVEKVNGMFSFTPDAHTLIGESLDVRGFWSCEAVWLTHGPGAAQAVAELMVEGQSSLDLREEDLNRFYPHVFTRAYIETRGAQNYREIYDIIHPVQPMERPRKLRLSPFYEREDQLGAVFFEAAGCERPQWYESNRSTLDGQVFATRSGWASRFWSPVQGAEHRAARERVVLFDATPFVKVEVSGPGALDYLQRIAANQMDQPAGKVTYTAMLNPLGGIMTDLTVTRVADDRFWVVTGGGVGMHDLAWMRHQLPDDGSVQLRDLTSSLCCIGVWGPRSRDLVQPLAEEDVSNQAFPYLSARPIRIGSVPAYAIRISYVGELGWEIYASTEYGLHLWHTLWEAGRPLGIAALGGGAFDSLRLEKGYRLWGADIHSEYNPYEAGLGFAVRLNKGEFIGREALLQIKDRGVDRKLCCMTFDDPTVVVMGKEPIFPVEPSPSPASGGGQGGGHALGYVTSANYGYTVGKSIIYGYLPLEFAAEGTAVEVQYFGRRHRATVTPEPLYDPAMTRLKELPAAAASGGRG